MFGDIFYCHDLGMFLVYVLGSLRTASTVKDYPAQQANSTELEKCCKQSWESPSGPVIRTWCFHCGGPSSIPGQGTKITQAAWHG